MHRHVNVKTWYVSKNGKMPLIKIKKRFSDNGFQGSMAIVFRPSELVRQIVSFCDKVQRHSNVTVSSFVILEKEPLLFY